MFQVETLCNWTLQVQGTTQMAYQEAVPSIVEIMLHLLESDRGMLLYQLMKMIKTGYMSIILGNDYYSPKIRHIIWMNTPTKVSYRPEGTRRLFERRIIQALNNHVPLCQSFRSLNHVSHPSWTGGRSQFSNARIYVLYSMILKIQQRRKLPAIADFSFALLN